MENDGDTIEIMNVNKPSPKPSSLKFSLSFFEATVASMVALSFIAGLLSVYLTMPDSDYSFLKRSRSLHDLQLLRYLKGSIDYAILFRRNSEREEATVSCFLDADWGEDKEDRKSIIGYFSQVFSAPILCSSKKQHVVALSSCEAEYIAEFYVVCQVIWIRSILEEMEVEVKKPLVFQIDNNSAINLAKNPVLHGRSKHIESRFHFFRETVNRGEV